MSRLVAVLSLLAVLVCPLVVQADAANSLSASMEELDQPGVIDPVNSPESDCGALVASNSLIQLDGEVLGFWTLLPLESFRPASFVSVDLAQFEPETVAQPWPVMRTRLSRLQTYLC
jgi:hypothetical protein